MIRVILLIFDPVQTWLKIAKAKRGYLFIFLVHLLPLMVVTIGLEAFAMTKLGEYRGEFNALSPDTQSVTIVPMDLALRYAGAEILFNLLAILIGAKMMQGIANSIHSQHTYKQCYTALAYGLSPIFLGHVLDAVPVLPTWICFTVGMLMSTTFLYQGIGRVLRPDRAKAFGLYLITIIIMTGLTGVAHLLSLLVLHPEFGERLMQRIHKYLGF